MITSFRTFILSAAVLAASSAFAAQPKSVSIPKLDNITVDGNPSDWADRGFRVDVMSTPTTLAAPMPNPRDFDGRFRLAWNEKGLLLLITVRDDTPDEMDPPQAFQADSIELFVSDKVGNPQWIQFLISPGCDPKHPELATHVNDKRSSAAKEKFPGSIAAARTKVPGGYVVEALIPWQNIAINPEQGRELGLQIYINDRDNGGSKKKLVWFPQDETHANPDRMAALKLSDKPDPAITAALAARFDHFRRTAVTVIAAPERAGQKVSAKLGSDSVSGNLELIAGRAQATLNLPLPKKDTTLKVKLDGHQLPAYALPDMATDRARLFAEQNIAAQWCVFDTTEFPKIDFLHPNLVDDLIGPYTLRYQYFDSDMNTVEIAAKPGRYAAVITVTPEKGPATRRLITLFRTADKGRWWYDHSPATIITPPEWGVSPDLAAMFPEAMGEAVRNSFFDHMETAPIASSWLAGLYECNPSMKESTYSGPFSKDRQYWVKLKRKLDGNDQRFTREVLPPQPLAGSPVPVLHDAALSAAGVKDDTRDKLDSLFKEWAEKSGEPFNVCIARHGVVIIDAAYGTRHGKPMTTETRSYVASISKALSASAMMTLVDQGLVALNDDVAKFLPVFAGTSFHPTIRNLYTHTAGLWSHRGDYDPDLDYRLAPVADTLKVGAKHEYNGMSLALGSRALEAVSGKPLPEFYNDQFFAPLGMKNTDSTSASYRTFTTAHDLAIFAQMMLNKGAYGDKRYLKPETIAAMMPRKINDLVPGSEIEWGMGLTWMNNEKTIFGHGSASSSTFWVDPSRDMIITMARNDAGQNFAHYQKRMTDLIAAQLK